MSTLGIPKLMKLVMDLPQAFTQLAFVRAAATLSELPHALTVYGRS